MIAFIHGIFAIIWFLFGLFMFRLSMKELDLKVPGTIWLAVFVIDIIFDYWPSQILFSQAFTGYTGDPGPWASAIWLGSLIVAICLWLFD